jgi:hypothetical protein
LTPIHPTGVERPRNLQKSTISSFLPHKVLKQVHAEVRFALECLCYIFKCADDYYRSPECQQRMEPVPEGLYMRTVVKPLYRFTRDQIDGNMITKRSLDTTMLTSFSGIGTELRALFSMKGQSAVDLNSVKPPTLFFRLV